MITIFNRAEVAVVYDVKRQGMIRDALKSNGIKYSLKVRNTAAGGSRGRIGSGGFNVSSSYEYKFFVKRTDYDRAVKIVQSCK